MADEPQEIKVVCQHCAGDMYLNRNGHTNGVQRWICRDCQRTRKVRSLKKFITNEFSLCSKQNDGDMETNPGLGTL